MMVSRKKLTLLAVLSVFSLAIASGVALAAEKIGVIEPNAVLSQHPKMAQVRKQIQEGNGLFLSIDGSQPHGRVIPRMVDRQLGIAHFQPRSQVPVAILEGR